MVHAICISPRKEDGEIVQKRRWANVAMQAGKQSVGLANYTMSNVLKVQATYISPRKEDGEIVQERC